jgi:hypothetical protein
MTVGAGAKSTVQLPGLRLEGVLAKIPGRSLTSSVSVGVFPPAINSDTEKK